MKGLLVIRLLVVLSWRNIFRNRRRTLLTLLAVSAGVWSCVALSAVARGMSTQLASDAIDLLTGHLQIHSPGYVDDPAIEHRFRPDHKGITQVLGLPDLVKHVERIRVPAVVMSERDSVGITLVGIDPDQERGVSFIGDALITGEDLSGSDDDGIILGEKCAAILKTQVGKRVVIMSQDVNNRIADRGFLVKGLFKAEVESTEKAFIFTGRKVAQDMLSMNGAISEISLITADRNEASKLMPKIKMLIPDFEVHTWRDLAPLIVSIINMQDQVLNFWFLIVVITVAFGLTNTMFMAIFERIREIGMVHALGMRPRLIILQIVTESLFLLIVGAIGGNLLAQLTIWFFGDGIDISQFARGAEIIGLRPLIRPVVYTRDLISANLLVLVVGILSSFYPAWKASRSNAAEALHAV